MPETLQVKKRQAHKNSVLRGLRQDGFVPAVVYGYQVNTTPIAVNERDLEKKLREDGRNAVLSLELDGKHVNAVLAEVQKDPLKDTLIHLDFLAVNMNRKIEMEVPILIVGESVGVKEGGSLQQPNREIKLFVEPSNIPESIELDITELGIGDSLAVVDIREQVDFDILHEDDFVLATVLPPVSDKDLEPSLEEGEVEADNGKEAEDPSPLED